MYIYYIDHANTQIFCSTINVLTVTFDQFNASLLKKRRILYKKKLY